MYLKSDSTALSSVPLSSTPVDATSVCPKHLLGAGMRLLLVGSQLGAAEAAQCDVASSSQLSVVTRLGGEEACVSYKEGEILECRAPWNVLG